MPIILILIGLGVGFFGGIEYRNYQIGKQRAGFARGADGGNFQRFVAGRTGANGQTGGFRGGAVQGSILSMDDKSMTVKLTDGSTKIVLLSDTTVYSDTKSEDKSTLTEGTEVAVFGSNNSDGSVTANSVQINPMMFKPQGSAQPKAQ